MNELKYKRLWNNEIPAGSGPGGGVNSVNSGTDITVDNTDPANPIINFTGSYQDPITVVANYSALPAVGTVSIPGKRLKVTGVKLSAFVQTVLVGGPCNTTFTLNYGHTAVSLATAEAATTKARRVVLLPELTQTVTAAQAVNTMISQPGGCVSMFTEPIYVNPGEFISLSCKHIGTVGTSGTIAYNIQYIYSWE